MLSCHHHPHTGAGAPHHQHHAQHKRTVRPVLPYSPGAASGAASTVIAPADLNCQHGPCSGLVSSGAGLWQEGPPQEPASFIRCADTTSSKLRHCSQPARRAFGASASTWLFCLLRSQARSNSRMAMCVWLDGVQLASWHPSCYATFFPCLLPHLSACSPLCFVSSLCLIVMLSVCSSLSLSPCLHLYLHLPPLYTQPCCNSRVYRPQVSARLLRCTSSGGRCWTTNASCCAA